MIPAGASVGVELSIDVEPLTATGVYAGYVLVSPVADAVLPVLLRVTAAGEHPS